LTNLKEEFIIGGKMIIYKGKAKGITFKRLLYTAFWQLARPIELLEVTDFSEN